VPLTEITPLIAGNQATATTGPLVVTTPGGSDTSDTFTVGASAPTVSDFAPAVGTPGTAVAITGGNFETAPTNNKLRFNLATAAISAATATTLNTTVPNTATSGRLTVTTPEGSAQSAADFFVPPAGFAAADVMATGRLETGGASLPLTIGTADKIGLAVFDGTAGQQVSLGMSAVSIGISDVTIFRPEGTTLVSLGWVVSNGKSLVMTLPVAGTYQILVDARPFYSGSMTLTLSEDLQGSIAIGGASVPVSLTRPGQRARLTFSGTAGQQVSLGLTAATVGSGVSLFAPDGTTVASGGYGTTPAALDSPPLPATGTYTILVDPSYAQTGNVTLTLSEEVTGTIAVGGASVPVSITRAGQRARFTFTGTSGQRLSLGWTGVTLPSGWVTIFQPDGTSLAAQAFGTGNAALDMPVLPVSGTYSILVDPSAADTGEMTLTLSEEVSGSIIAGGSPVGVSITRAGQRSRLSFAGTAGMRVSLTGTNSTFTQSGVSLWKPDGTYFAWFFDDWGPGTWFGGPHTLPTTGTYSILVDPAVAYTGSHTLSLYDVPPDVTGSMTINGPVVPVTIATPGQNASLTFEATAGQPITIRGSNSIIGCLSVFVDFPGGGGFSMSPCTASWFAPHTPATTGTYTVRLDPTGANAGAVDMSVTNP
jgi:hypothetical protein